MIRMRRTDMAPPRGWIVTPPLVPNGIRHWVFNDALRDVQQHHPEYTRADASIRVEHENALRCLQEGAENFVWIDDTLLESATFSPSFPVLPFPAVKPHIPVTLLAVDTSPKAYLAARAIERCLEQADFDDVKLLTTDMSLPHAVKIDPIIGLDGYSKFCIRDMHRYVDTSHVLVAQWDGYVLNGAAWNPTFLEFDYIGSPWLPSQHVGNGGFSLRSKRLLNTLLTIPGQEHPEDNFICVQHMAKLAQAGLKFAPYQLAARFGFEGRSWNGAGKEWEGVPIAWSGQFGFHSFLTPLPPTIDRPKVFHHSGDMGDAIYGLATMKNLGGGTLFISADNRYPYPAQTRNRATPEWCGGFASLANQQDYVWNTQWTHALPFSTDYDLNEFRKYYQHPVAGKKFSLFSLHQEQFGAHHPETEPWLRVDHPLPVAPIVVNRTNRYRNELFPWRDLVTRYATKMVFVGTEAEHHAFNAESGAPAIRWQPTSNLLELAQVIAGAKVFIGNQSCPMAIAFGLGQNIIQEVWPGSPDCVLSRRNAIYYTGGTLDIPKGWLRDGPAEIEEIISNRRVTLVYHHLASLDQPWLDYSRRFVQSYRDNPPGLDHDTIIVCNNGPARAETLALFGFMPNVTFLSRGNDGQDIGGYIEASRMVKTETMLCLGTYTYMKRGGWLKRMMDAWDKHGPGLYATSSSNQIRPHVQTTGFLCSPKLLVDYPVKIVSKKDRYRFEHGEECVTNFALLHHIALMLVTWSGEYGWTEWRSPQNIFWCGSQEDCLFWRPLMEQYEADPINKRLREDTAAGLNVQANAFRV